MSNMWELFLIPWAVKTRRAMSALSHSRTAVGDRETAVSVIAVQLTCHSEGPHMEILLEGQTWMEELDMLKGCDGVDEAAVVAGALLKGVVTDRSAKRGILGQPVCKWKLPLVLDHLLNKILRQDVAAAGHVAGARQNPVVILLNVPLI
mmetsp:Transcript_38805/g.109797  ORF Transcript_38805/g.109797 Transcript_38805/m.109797 type:complete len:149 (+) Transcript_38805:1308-1754(+)